MTRQVLHIILFIIAICSSQSYSQNRLEILENTLEEKSFEIPALNERLDISMSEVSLKEFLRAIAKKHKLNLDVDESLTDVVVNNYKDVSILSVLLYLAGEYSLDISFIGNIVSISRYEYIAYVPPPVPKEICVSWYEKDSVISLDLEGDSIGNVFKEITKKTSVNVLFDQALNNKLLTAYILNAPLREALALMANLNEMDFEKTSGNVYVFRKKAPGERPLNDRKKLNVSQGKDFTFEVKKKKIDLYANNYPLDQIILALAESMDINYVLLSDFQKKVSIHLSAYTWEDVLEELFRSSEYDFLKDGNTYYLGKRLQEGIRETKVYSFKHRTLSNVMEVIPNGLSKDVQLQEFRELNALILSGSGPQIQEVEAFLKAIDKPVPMIFIEVMILDYNSNYNLSAGVEFGVNDEPVKGGGQIYPETNYTLDAVAVNDLLASFSGFGAINLGKVSPNFYMTIQAMETNGILKVRSTPNLSTLNGHPANMSIGSTEYYVVENSNIVGVQNPQSVVTRQYSSVQADLSISIEPIVSNDGYVTLEIEVQQSDFTNRITPEAPPGQVSRSFKSMIRVENEEMILLGGLEEKQVEDTGSGVPVLSRIWGLKWLFSKRNKSSAKTKLNIFIKPKVLK